MKTEKINCPYMAKQNKESIVEQILVGIATIGGAMGLLMIINELFFSKDKETFIRYFHCPNCEYKRLRWGTKKCPNCNSLLRWPTKYEKQSFPQQAG
jgi:ssDNA-binding Zn-finger/Zn-ribbon topoisomerase 1